MTKVRLASLLLVVVVGAGAFLAGRATVDRSPPAPARGSFGAGYLAGREAAFAGFDGGWRYGTPYVVTLRQGPPGITYRFADRRPLVAGVEYRRCGATVCGRRAP
jgi:hypothetical protein